jgi:hypothetical protein
MDPLFQTNRYLYDDPFGNEHTYLFTYGEADKHPYNLTPPIETCQTSFMMTSSSETQRNISAENTTQNKSILSMQDIMILHENHIYPQSHKYDFRAYNTHTRHRYANTIHYQISATKGTRNGAL